MISLVYVYELAGICVGCMACEVYACKVSYACMGYVYCIWAWRMFMYMGHGYVCDTLEVCMYSLFYVVFGVVL